MAKEKNEVAVEEQVEEPAVHKEEWGMEGFEDGQETLQSIPILALAQSQTPEVVDGNIEGLKAGVLMDSVTKKPLGSKLELIPFMTWNSRTKFPPRGSGASIECFSPDGIMGSQYGKCSECSFSNFDSPDRCQDQICFLVGAKENPREQYRIIFAKSNYRVGKTLKNMLRTSCIRTQAPLFSRTFILETDKQFNKSANAYYYTFKASDGTALPSDLVGSTLFEMYNNMVELRKDSKESFYASLKDKETSPDVEDQIASFEDLSYDGSNQDGADLL